LTNGNANARSGVGRKREPGPKPRLVPYLPAQQLTSADIDAKINAAIEQLITRFLDPVFDEIGKLIA
jgi:hypothetical protein